MRRLDAMNALLSLTEMQQRFPGQWVLVSSPRFDRQGRLRSGAVLAHSANRDEVYERLRETEARFVNVEYMGEVPSDLGVAL